jgi:hypothetical protein
MSSVHKLFCIADVSWFDSWHDQEIFLFHKLFKSTMRPNRPSVQWVLADLSWVVKAPGREAGHSHASSIEVKNVWSFTSIFLRAFKAPTGLTFFFVRGPAANATDARSREAYYAILWWRWLVFSFFRVMGHRWNETDSGKPKYSGKKKPVPVPLCPQQIPHGLTRDRTCLSHFTALLYPLL